MLFTHRSFKGGSDDRYNSTIFRACFMILANMEFPFAEEHRTTVYGWCGLPEPDAPITGFRPDAERYAPRPTPAHPSFIHAISTSSLMPNSYNGKWC